MNVILYKIFSLLFVVMEYAIFAEIILSFVMRGVENKFTYFIHSITEPLLAPGRKIQEKIMPGFMIDFSPILALFIISILRQIVRNILF
ncbi:YggT family protein [Clostridium pascui]|uniref:YggT family protein n=1 Tax=Clostridium pascui TaxID=46609 RepID=UPI00195DF8FD|nr:YggT family protein [Clostridium pascui]MBM7869359.1 YggT family protein [Clostridium pascui]